MAMTPRERFLAALDGQPVDRVPVANPTSIITRGLQEKAGVFFPEANYEAEPMAEVLATVLAMDKDQRAELSSAAIANVREHFSKQAMCEKTLDVYNEVLHEWGRA